LVSPVSPEAAQADASVGPPVAAWSSPDEGLYEATSAGATVPNATPPPTASTSPATAPWFVGGVGRAVAVNAADTGTLKYIGLSDTLTDNGLAMQAGTSPAIATSADGGGLVAVFVGSDLPLRNTANGTVSLPGAAKQAVQRNTMAAVAVNSHDGVEVTYDKVVDNLLMYDGPNGFRFGSGQTMPAHSGPSITAPQTPISLRRVRFAETAAAGPAAAYGLGR
jgi:hypothetical protein